MPDYQKLYTTLFNAVSDAIGALSQQNYGTALNILCKAQRTAEELYLSDTELEEPSETEELRSSKSEEQKPATCQ